MFEACFSGEEYRDRAANAGIPSGDERYPVFQLPGADVKGRVIHRLRVERGLHTGLTLMLPGKGGAGYLRASSMSFCASYR